MNSPATVPDFIRRHVPDWDDELVALARFKAFSGQRSDWEPRFFFWRDLILKVSRHLGLFILRPSDVKNNWFTWQGLKPLCIDHVLLEMYNNGEILLYGDLIDPSSGFLYRTFKRLGIFISRFRSSSPQGPLEEHLILKAVMQERADAVCKVLCESHWNSICVITMEKFISMWGGLDEASAMLSYLYGDGKARCFSVSRRNFIEGVKISIVPKAALQISALDCDSLHLMWTMDKLERQLHAIDQCNERSKRSALQCLKCGNKQAALRHVRQMKMTCESRKHCTTLINRVEEVLSAIANAESTKEVSETIQTGVRAMKEIGVNADELYIHLEALDEAIALQKQVEETLVSTPFLTPEIEDEDVEDEFKRLEVELDYEEPQIESVKDLEDDALTEGSSSDLAGSLRETFSSLKLEAA